MVPCTHGLSRSSVANVPRLLLLCARSCLRAVSSPGMPYALPTTAMLWMQSSTSSLFPFFRSCAMASFANCSCSALAFSIVILNPPSVFWALPVSTQWHIHSECPSSNTNKKPAQILRFAESKKEPLSRKILGKAAQKALGKGTGPSNLLKSILASFCYASKNGRKKARKSLKLLGFSQRHLFGCSLMVETGGLEPSTSCV